MKGDLKRVRLSILSGSCLTLVIYLLWSLFILGVVPFEGKNGILDGFLNQKEASLVLKAHLQSPVIGAFTQGFALFAIITSFLAQAMGLMHFIADGLHVQPERNTRKWLIVLTLLPPLFLAQIYPKIFF